MEGHRLYFSSLPPFLTIPNLGVRKNSFLPLNNASKTAIVLLTDTPVAKNIKNKYRTFTFHFSPQISDRVKISARSRKNINQNTKNRSPADCI